VSVERTEADRRPEAEDKVAILQFDLHVVIIIISPITIIVVFLVTTMAVFVLAILWVGLEGWMLVGGPESNLQGTSHTARPKDGRLKHKVAPCLDSQT